jgi:hypothetical protein
MTPKKRGSGNPPGEVEVKVDPAEKEVVAGDALVLLEKLAGTIDAPEDWADEHDHYLYGTPKRTDRSQ